MFAQAQADQQVHMKANKQYNGGADCINIVVVLLRIFYLTIVRNRCKSKSQILDFFGKTVYFWYTRYVQLGLNLRTRYSKTLVSAS